MSPYVLGTLAFAMFGLGVWQHYSMFPYEYRMSMASDIIKQYSGYIMLLAIIFSGITAILFMFGVTPPAPVDIIPEIAMPNMPNMQNITGDGGILDLAGNNAKPANAGLLGNAGLFGANKPMNKPMNKPANSGLFGANNPANNLKRNNVASTSFKVT